MLQKNLVLVVGDAEHEEGVACLSMEAVADVIVANAAWEVVEEGQLNDAFRCLEGAKGGAWEVCFVN
jgi:hypothetical protein